MSKQLGATRAKQIVKITLNRFRRKNLQGFPVDTPYTKEELDQMMKRCGFSLKGYEYNNFVFIPRILLRFFPSFYIWISERVSQKNPHRFANFAVNYIGRYVLNRSA